MDEFVKYASIVAGFFMILGGLWSLVSHIAKDIKD